MTFLLKKAVYAKKVGSPSPEANDVKATPVNATVVVSAKATQIKPPMATMQEKETRTFAQNGRNGDKLLIINPGMTSARRTAPVERWLQGRVPKGNGVVVSDSS